MIFNPGKIAALSRLCWVRGVALVVVGFPATPLQTSRAGICISAAHTRKDLDNALKVTTASVVNSLRSARACPTASPR